MRQHPPTGPDDETAGTPDAPGAATPEAAGDETQAFEQSPYDVPETPTEEVPADYGATYSQAPDPSRTIYSETTSTSPPEDDEEPAGRRRWLVPAIIVAIVLIAGAVAAYLLFGGGDEDDPLPAPSDTVTEEPTTEAPTEEPTGEEPTTEEPTTEEPTTEEPTEAPTEGALLDDLEETVVVGDVTFTLDDDGWVPAQAIVDDGAVEAYEGLFVGGDEEIEMIATLWSDNEAADAFAQTMVDELDADDQVDSGDTYSDGTGTYWAFVLGEGQGRYIWTSDRGHVFQITGSTDFVSGFFSGLPL